MLEEKFWGAYARQQGTTIGATARHIGVSRRTLYFFVDGRRKIRKEKCQLLAAHWNLKVKALMKLIDDYKAEEAGGPR